MHFKVRTGTKFKKVRLFDFFSLVARSLVEERNYALALFSNPRRRELISAHKIFSSLSHNVLIKQIFDAFLQRKSLQPGSVRVLFDGERVREDQSPQEVDMEDGDSLDVMMEQVRRVILRTFKTIEIILNAHLKISHSCCLKGREVSD